MTNDKYQTTYECPFCEADVPLPNGDDGRPMGEFAALSVPFKCPTCGQKVELDGDYISEDSWIFMLVPAS